MQVVMIVPPVVVEPVIVISPMVIPIVIDVDVVVLSPVVPLVPIVDAVRPMVRPVARSPLLAAATLTRSRWTRVVTGPEWPVVIPWSTRAIAGSQLLTTAVLSGPGGPIAAAGPLLSTAALARSSGGSITTTGSNLLSAAAGAGASSFARS
jgi:hypothetical protein